MNKELFPTYKDRKISDMLHKGTVWPIGSLFRIGGYYKDVTGVVLGYTIDDRYTERTWNDTFLRVRVLRTDYLSSREEIYDWNWMKKNSDLLAFELQ